MGLGTPHPVSSRIPLFKKVRSFQQSGSGIPSAVFLLPWIPAERSGASFNGGCRKTGQPDPAPEWPVH